LDAIRYARRRALSTRMPLAVLVQVAAQLVFGALGCGKYAVGL
jgi:hypothetical protein